MKATELIETQHRAVEELFERILAQDCNVTRLVDELARKLLAHMLVEEVVLFPELMRLDEAVVREAIEEHTVARFELRRVLKASVLEPDFTAKVTTLRRLIEHRVREEERDLLPKIDASLSPEANEQLGYHMEELFKTLVLRSSRTGREQAATHDFIFC